MELNLGSGASDSTVAASQHKLCHLGSVGGFRTVDGYLYHSVTSNLSHISPQIPTGLCVGSSTGWYSKGTLKITEAKEFLASLFKGFIVSCCIWGPQLFYVPNT